jgi:hypothetical protein
VISIIGTEQLHTVIEKRYLGSPDTVVIYTSANDLRRAGNLYYVMGDVYYIENMAKTKFSTSTVVLSGDLRRPDLSWRCIGAVNKIYEWVAKTLVVTFYTPTLGWTTGSLVQLTFTLTEDVRDT